MDRHGLSMDGRNFDLVKTLSKKYSLTLVDTEPNLHGLSAININIRPVEKPSVDKVVAKMEESILLGSEVVIGRASILQEEVLKEKIE